MSFFFAVKMKLSSIALALVTVASATANPFAGVSKRNAKSAYVSKLIRSAKETENSQLRKLDEEEYAVDISGYAVKFEQCQFVKTYSDELAQEEDYNTVLATQRFALFRLCPSDACSSCSSNFGEYLVDLDTYLEATVGYYQEVQENMCNSCEESCQQDDAAAAEDEAEDGGRRLAVDCDTCVDECDKIENMEENGYIDATEFLECQMVYDPEDDASAALYAGPMCASSGTKIKIGIFTDEYCQIHDDSLDVESYLVDGDGYAMKLSHALLKNTYATDVCISCTAVDENADEDAEADADAEVEVAEICEQLYEASAKCELTNGFANGYSNYDGYENQLAQEEVVCNYMASLVAGTYGEDGEIVLNGGSSSGSSKSTTGGQKFALAFFIIGTVGLAAYAAVLHSKLTKGGKADLSRQGGAMA
jgi:NAD-dependent dihydropyrimidine dehydrogenase PreA subunit